MNGLIGQLVKYQRKATAEQIAEIVDHVGAAPFATELLEVNAPLWGGFWHGDVIAPGYSLPAVELALLRAIRLDRHWPEGTNVEQFVTDLHQAVQDPQAGVWTLALAGEPCVIFAGPPLTVELANRELITVVCYCATTERLHAGYRTAASGLHLAEAVEQRSAGFVSPSGVSGAKAAPDWIEQVMEQDRDNANHLDARLDNAILRMRIGQPT